MCVRGWSGSLPKAKRCCGTCEEATDRVPPKLQRRRKEATGAAPQPLRRGSYSGTPGPQGHARNIAIIWIRSKGRTFTG